MTANSRGPILILGASGQLGRALTEICPKIFSQDKSITLGRHAADLSNPSSLKKIFDDYKPRVVINAAAYTKVDLAENEETLASVINGEAPGVLAEGCKKLNIPFIHFSTDYVFSDLDESTKNADGALMRPWTEQDKTNPINAYGRSKLAGENAVQAVGGDYFIFRTSWVYDKEGANFANTMLRLGQERAEISVVNDQFGAPTYAPHLAHGILTALKISCARGEFASGIYHACGAGETTWYGFAHEIFAHLPKDASLKLGRLVPVSSKEYQTPARRPKNSRLDCAKLKSVFGLELPHWREGLRQRFSLEILPSSG